MDSLHLGKKVERLIKLNGDTVEDLSKKMGYTKAGLHKILNKPDLNTEILKKIAETYRVDIGYFFSGDFSQKGKINAVGEPIVTYRDNEEQKLLEKENEGLRTEIRLLREQVAILTEMIQLLKGMK